MTSQTKEGNCGSDSGRYSPCTKYSRSSQFSTVANLLADLKAGRNQVPVITPDFCADRICGDREFER